MRRIEIPTESEDYRKMVIVFDGIQLNMLELLFLIAYSYDGPFIFVLMVRHVFLATTKTLQLSVCINIFQGKITTVLFKSLEAKLGARFKFCDSSDVNMRSAENV